MNPWLLLGLIAAWRWRDRPVAGGLAVAALVICKLFLWPVLGWLLLSRRYRAAAVAMVVTGLTLGLGFTFGPLGGSAYASMLHVLSGLEAPHAAGLSGLLIHWHASLSLATVIATAIALLLLAAAGYQYRRGPQDDGREVLVFGAAVVAALFASPIVWHHYYLLLAAPLLLGDPVGVAVRRHEPGQLGGRGAARHHPGAHGDRLRAGPRRYRGDRRHRRQCGPGAGRPPRTTL